MCCTKCLVPYSGRTFIGFYFWTVILQDLFPLFQRPIVEFSLENKSALEAKQRRIERNQVKIQMLM